jgi:hypothetical protein
MKARNKPRPARFNPPDKPPAGVRTAGRNQNESRKISLIAKTAKRGGLEDFSNAVKGYFPTDIFFRP